MKKYSNRLFLIGGILLIIILTTLMRMDVSLVRWIHEIIGCLKIDFLLYKKCLLVFIAVVIGLIVTVFLLVYWADSDDKERIILIIGQTELIVLILISAIIAVLGLHWKTTCYLSGIVFVGIAALLVFYYSLVIDQDFISSVAAGFSMLALVSVFVFSIVITIHYRGNKEPVVSAVVADKLNEEENRVEDILAVAEDYYSIGDIDRAIEEINAGISVYPEADELKERLTLYQTAMLQGMPQEHEHSLHKTSNENQINATCQHEGSFDLVKYCSCGIELSRERVTIPVVEHDYQKEIVEASCSEKGKVSEVCIYCGNIAHEEDIPAKGHSYKEGVCSICKSEDPNYVKQYSSGEIQKMFDDSVVSSSNGYFQVSSSEKDTVFAQDITDAFGLHTLVSYNMWGESKQFASFSCLNGLADLKYLTFYVGGRTGGKGTMSLSIFVDKDVSDTPTLQYDINMGAPPTEIKLNLTDATIVTFAVENEASNENVILFYGFSNSGE